MVGESKIFVFSLLLYVIFIFIFIFNIIFNFTLLVKEFLWQIFMNIGSYEWSLRFKFSKPIRIGKIGSKGMN